MARKAQHAYDPKRRTRRHHYQEGPGFLFVATQGGRPPHALSEASLKRVRERMRAVRLAKERGALDACRQTGCSRPSLYRWIAASDAKGISGLQEASRRPHRLQPCVPAWVERVVITVRLLTYWNSKRIAAEMERRQIYRVGHDYIDRLLAANGCARGSVTRERGPRYEGRFKGVGRERLLPSLRLSCALKASLLKNVAGRRPTAALNIPTVRWHPRSRCELRG